MVRSYTHLNLNIKNVHFVKDDIFKFNFTYLFWLEDIQYEAFAK